VSSFVVRTVVACLPEAAFAAGLDIDLHLASMAGSGERAIAGVTGGQIGLGETVTWRARHFGLLWRMTSTITAYERPGRFVDEQVRGPFRSWRHEHLFAAHEQGTLMTDVVDFEAPAGVIGWLVAATVLRPYLRRLIVERNASLKAALEA
jgi:ligand-binding SRPBCC domain-containing protein